jgi:chromosome segregation ATPase
VSEINQAIKIEQLKQEWHTKRAELQLIIVRDFKPRLQTVDSQLKSIEQEKRELNAKIFALEEKLKETDAHYSLLIRAIQSLSQEQTKRPFIGGLPQKVAVCPELKEATAKGGKTN